MKASMAVVATRTLATGRTLPGVKMWPVESDDIRYRDEEKNYTLNLPQKQSVSWCRISSAARNAQQTGCCQAPSQGVRRPFLVARGRTRAHKLHKDRCRALGRHARLKHRQHCAGSASSAG